MSTKMKGLFKGLRYISQIFDEEQQKEQDMQIGLPTDVKHVAHVGWDGPASANSADSPWMPSTPGMAAPYDSKAGKDSSDVKWVSEDSKRAQKTKKSGQEKEQQAAGGEGIAKPSRRRSTDNNPLEEKDKASRRQSADNAAAKPRQPRRTHPKDSSDAANPDAPKKTRRKKSEAAADQPRRSKNRPSTNGGDAAPHKQLSEDDDEDREEGRLD